MLEYDNDIGVSIYMGTYAREVSVRGLILFFNTIYDYMLKASVCVCVWV